jgi:8-oxo-dGTP diphosphatase
MEAPHFNIRVYGFLMDEGKVLVTDEFRLGILMTKFPGGGLKYGEGLIDCLKREFREELQTEINIISHYYTTDFFQATTLLPFESQLINVYYLVNAEKPFQFVTTENKYDFPEIVDGAQCFRWIAINDLVADEFTFPIDKMIIGRLKTDFK